MTEVTKVENAMGNHPARTKKRGFTLTEIAIVLGIVGLILGAVWTAASGVYQSTSATNFAQAIGPYVAAMRAYCANNASSCTVQGNQLPVLQVSIPSLGTTIVPNAAKPVVVGANGYFDIQWGYTTTNSDYKGCIGMVTGMQSLGGVVSTSTGTVDGYTTPASTGTCSKQGATPGCAAGSTTQIFIAVPNSCTGSGANLGSCIESDTAAQVCTAGKAGTIVGSFSTSF